MVGLHQMAALQRFHVTRNSYMEKSVSDAIASLMSEGKAISFYNVASRAQIARSTLYRRQNLRAMVEKARDGHSTGGRSARRYAELAQENEILKREIVVLRYMLEKTGNAGAPMVKSRRTAMVEYFVVSLHEAA